MTSGTYSGSYSAAITLSAAYVNPAIIGTVAASGFATTETIAPNRTVEVVSIYAAVFGPAGTTFTASNTGVIHNTASAASFLDSGMLFAASGTLTNQGAITGGSGVAVFGTSASDILNSGLIQGSALAVGNQPGGEGVLLYGGGGTITNTGMILGADNGVIALKAPVLLQNETSGGSVGTISSTGYYGVQLDAGGTVTNQGVVRGGTVGVALHQVGSVQNSGTIAATGVGTTYAYVGVEFRYNGSVTNSGMITGANSGIYASNSSVNITNASGGTIRATGTGTQTIHSYAGVYLRHGGSVFNAGAISATQFGVYAQTLTAYVANSGSIVASATSAMFHGTILARAAAGVDLQAGGTVVNQAGGLAAGYSGVVIAGGPDAVFNSGHIAEIGPSGYGVYLGSGGSVTNAATASITGGGANSTGIFINHGTGTVINNGVVDESKSNLYGVHLLSGGTVINGASATITGGLAVAQQAFGTVINDAGGVISGGIGVFLNGGGSVTNNAGGTISGAVHGVEADNATATVVNAGTIVGSGTAATALSLATGHANLLVAVPGAAFIGTVDGGNFIGGTIASTLELASGASSGTLSGLGSQYVNFDRVTFDPAADWLLVGNTIGLASGQIISGFANNDTIELTGLTETIQSYAGGTLTLDGSATVSIHLPGTFTTASFHATSVAGGTDITLACFAAGTRIHTKRGETAVERLRIGDHVAAVFDGEQTIVWIGRRRVNCARHPRPHQVWPVRISAGAFGPGQPGRDLMLSPDHAVHIRDVLIPVKHLINGATIVQVPVGTVTYYHVELPRHDVLLADGLPVESYLDTGDRGNFTNGGNPITLYPDFGFRVREAEGCAPLIVTGPQLAAARRQVNVYAALSPRSVA